MSRTRKEAPAAAAAPTQAAAPPPAATPAPVALQAPATSNPFARSQSDALAPGAVEIESQRAAAEVQGRLVVAMRFPRDPFKAFAEMIDACKRPGLAAEAFYSFPRGGETVTGPSIRLAEELARCWRHVDYGMRELSNRDGVTEMEAFAWDMESNTLSRQTFMVRHLRDRKGGSVALTDQRDIYEIAANMGARRLRARILAVLPADYVEAAIAQCKQTLAGGVQKPLADRIKGMIARFGALGVSAQALETRLGHPLDRTLPEELADLHGIFCSLKDGLTKASEWFAPKLEAPGSEAPALPEPAGAQVVPPAQAPAPASKKKLEQIEVRPGESDEQAIERARAEKTAAPAAPQQAPATPAPKPVDDKELF